MWFPSLKTLLRSGRVGERWGGGGMRIPKHSLLIPKAQVSVKHQVWHKADFATPLPTKRARESIPGRSDSREESASGQAGQKEKVNSLGWGGSPFGRPPHPQMKSLTPLEVLVIGGAPESHSQYQGALGSHLSLWVPANCTLPRTSGGYLKRRWGWL